MRYILYLTGLLLVVNTLYGQTSHIRKRGKYAISGSDFGKSISSDTLSLEHREELIYEQVRKGNIPDFLKTPAEVTDTVDINAERYIVRYYVFPDYLSIGSNEDYFYISATPKLAQKIANLFKCSLPTRKMVDDIYKSSSVKLEPLPIPPTVAMTTVPVFLKHNRMVIEQLRLQNARQGELTAGNKKDIIISNKIYGESSRRVVIYGWHKPDGKPIQPLYNKHISTWADYSHGMRLVCNVVYINNQKISLKKILKDPKLNKTLSDEGPILKPYYPEK